MRTKPVNHGLILFEIEKDGCLNGVYTNEGADGGIQNMMAVWIKTPREKNTKKAKKKEKSDPLLGDYRLTYHDDMGTYSGVMTIEHFQKKKKTYYLKLKVEHKLKYALVGNTLTTKMSASADWHFNGIGFMMNERQLAVQYKTNPITV